MRAPQCLGHFGSSYPRRLQISRDNRRLQAARDQSTDGRPRHCGALPYKKPPKISLGWLCWGYLVSLSGRWSQCPRFGVRGYQGTHDSTPVLALLSLVSNAILYWNTSRISNIVDSLRRQGETVADETLAPISLLLYKHVLPNGMYFIDDEKGES
jgi:hypothetical protein